MSVFIDGPYVERASSSNCTPSNCWSYRFDVAAGGDRLRIGIDHPDHRDHFTLQLVDPSGAELARAEHGYLETPELIVPPQQGTWTVNVIASDVVDSRFKLRAALEKVTWRRSPGRRLLPNLRAEPGFDFSFVTSAGSNLGPSTVIPTSCHPDEMAENLAVRCLRFSFGYQNAGEGPMDLHFSPLSDASTVTATVEQRIYLSDRTPTHYSDNRYVERPAGTSTYHKIHGHYHYDHVFEAQLFRVKGRRLMAVGEAAKRGACAHDWVLVDFERVYQDPAGTADSGSDCNFSFTNPASQEMRIGLSTGWADIYTANLSDNYVDFGLKVDGRYLVRVWADRDGRIAEVDEKDNVAYSLIDVAGNEVSLLERGRGRSPWDQSKKELIGLGD